MRTRVISVLIVGVLLSGCLGSCLLGRYIFSEREYTVAVLDCGKGRQIILKSWVRHEGISDLHYEVRADGLAGVSTTATDARGRAFWEAREPGFDFGQLHYSTVVSKDGELVGVVAREFPYSLIVVHDFATGESWPHDLRRYQQVKGEKVRGSLHDGLLREQALRERLEQDNPQLGAVAKLRDKAYLEERGYLDLSYSQVGDDDLARLAGHSKLEVLRLESSLITDRGLIHLTTMPQLRTLLLSHTAITDVGLTHLGHAKGLWSVELNGSIVTRQGIEALRKRLPNVEIRWQE
jgi:hypothetical protein